MARVIWKFALGIPDTQIDLVPGFTVAAVGMQAIPGSDGEAPFIWIEQDVDGEPRPQRFEIYGTGHHIQPKRRWVGTFFDEPFVWHVFYVPHYFDGGSDG